MKHIFIINPAAGGGDAEAKYLPMIIHAAKAAAVDYEIHRSLSAADTTSWVRQRAMQGDPVRFYAVGGDGTVNDVMSGLVSYPNTELAVLPCGSGNDFVRNWTKSSGNFSIEALMNGKSKPVDVIKYNDSYCINMLNIGADCDVVVVASQIKDRFKGAASYLVAATKVLPKGPKYRMIYSIDDGEEIEGDFLLMCIANGKYCGGGFQSCPKAKIADGKMDLCLIKPIAGPKILPLLMKYRAGKHLTDKKLQKLNLVTYVSCEKFKLKALHDVNLSKDGEVEIFEEAEFTVLNKAVNLVIPSDSEFIDY